MTGFPEFISTFLATSTLDGCKYCPDPLILELNLKELAQNLKQNQEHIYL